MSEKEHMFGNHLLDDHDHGRKKGLKSERNSVDEFFHYDSSTEDEMKVKVRHPGVFYWSAHNIAVTFSDGVIPDEFTGYLCLSELNNEQAGIVHASGNSNRKIGGVLFPIYRPQTVNPKCMVYNRVHLEKNDQFKVRFVCKDLSILSTDRIVVDFHCVENSKKLYIA